jgi:hypothetical protein
MMKTIKVVFDVITFLILSIIQKAVDFVVRQILTAI